MKQSHPLAKKLLVIAIYVLYPFVILYPISRDNDQLMNLTTSLLFVGLDQVVLLGMVVLAYQKYLGLAAAEEDQLAERQKALLHKLSHSSFWYENQFLIYGICLLVIFFIEINILYRAWHLVAPLPGLYLTFLVLLLGQGFLSHFIVAYAASNRRKIIENTRNRFLGNDTRI